MGKPSPTALSDWREKLTPPEPPPTKQVVTKPKLNGFLYSWDIDPDSGTIQIVVNMYASNKERMKAKLEALHKMKDGREMIELVPTGHRVKL